MSTPTPERAPGPVAATPGPPALAREIRAILVLYGFLWLVPWLWAQIVA